MEEKQDEFSEGWDEAEAPTEDAEEKEEAEKPEEEPSKESDGEKEPQKEEPPTPKGEEKPWYEADTTLSEDVRQKIRSFNGMFVSERKKREELESEVNRLKTPPKEEPKKDEPSAYDFEAAEDRYMDALIDGDKETAKTIRREIDAKKEEALLEKARGTVRADREQETRQSIEKDIEDVRSKVYEKYPFLDPNADFVNNRAIREINTKSEEYFKAGMPVKDALQKAVDEVAPQHLKTESQVDKEKLRKMEAVKTKSSPISGGGKGKADKNDYESAWDEA